MKILVLDLSPSYVVGALPPRLPFWGAAAAAAGAAGGCPPGGPPPPVGHLLRQGVLQLVVLPQADLPLVLLHRQVGLLLPLAGQELAAAVVVASAPFLR
jgi:hypothetical protein